MCVLLYPCGAQLAYEKKNGCSKKKKYVHVKKSLYTHAAYQTVLLLIGLRDGKTSLSRNFHCQNI